MGNPVSVPTLPSGVTVPPFFTQIKAITDAQGQPTDIITPDEGNVTVSGITDAGPDTSSTIQAFLVGYQLGAGLPEEFQVYATSDAEQSTDLHETDSQGKELYSWSLTLPTAGLAPGVYALQSFVHTLAVQETNGVPTEIYVYEPDQGTVTVQEAVPYTYVVHEDTEIVSVGAAQSDTTVFLSGANSTVQLSTDGRYAVWTSGDEYEEDLQTGATVDLTTTGGSAPALAASDSPTQTAIGSPDPYGPQPNGGYADITYPTFTAGGVTFGSIPDFDFNPNAGSQNPLPTVTDANGNTEVLGPFGTTPEMVGYAAAASDNGNAVLTVETTDVSYFTPYSSSGTSASPQYYITYRSPAPTLTLDPVNGTNQFSPGASSVTLTGTSSAIGQTVEIDFGQAGAKVGTATVQADGSWSYTFDASTITGSSLFIEASVTSAQGTPAEVSETAEINSLPVTTVTGIRGADEDLQSTFGPGNTLTVYVNTSAPVFVSGTPTLTLSNGEVAAYIAGSGTQQIDFTYVPAINDPGSSDLAVTGLKLTGGATITDANGNMLAGPFTRALGLTLQTVPIIDSLYPDTPSSDFITNSATPGIVVSAEAGETVTVYDNGIAVGTGTTPDLGDPTITKTEIATTTPLPGGQSTLTAIATDGSGRSSAASSPITITVDTKPPAEQIAGLAVNGNDDLTLAAQASLAITVTGQLSAALQPGESLVIVLPNGQTDTIALASGATSFTFTPSAAEAVSFGAGGTISVYVVDAAGNVGNATTQKFTADAQRVIKLVSADPADPSQVSGMAPALSADGTTVAFQGRSGSSSDNALLADSRSDATVDMPQGIYVENLSTGAVTLAEADGEAPALSGDGTILAYDEQGSSSLQVYAKNLATGSVTLVSAASGVVANDESFAPSISANGTEIAFLSYADNLVAGVGSSGGTEQLYVATLSGGAVSGITAVSVAADGTSGNGSINTAALSGDGSEVVFSSTDTNLLAAGDQHTPNLAASTGQIYVRALTGNTASGLTANQVVLVSGNADGTVGNATSDAATLSANGRYVVFTSKAINLSPDNLGPGVTLPNGVEQVYVKDLLTGALSLVSQTAKGVVGDADAVDASISSDGTTVVFSDGSDNFGAGAVGEQLYAASLSDGVVTGLTLLSEPGAIPADGFTAAASLSADGKTVVFQSTADNLVAGASPANNVYETTTGQSVAPPPPVADTFEENQASTSGAFSGDYLWSNAANWSAGVPAAGSAVQMAAVGVDDLAGLSLASLSLSGPNNDADGQLFVTDGLAVNTLSLTSSARIDVDGTGPADTLTITGSASTTLSNGAAPTLDADGAGAVVEDREAKVPDALSYIAQNGGEVELAGAPSATSQLVFGGGTIALAAPGATIAAKLSDIGTGDVLELPGTSVSAVTFGAASLTITTDTGTFDFTDVTYAQGNVASYSVSHGNSTGLEAISFTGPDVFTANQAATSGAFSGDYLWSNAANWSAGVPAAGSAVQMAAVGVDDLAGLSLASLSLSGPNNGTDGQLFVEDGLTVNTLSLTSSARIDVDGTGKADTLTIAGSASTTLSNGAAPTLDADGAGAVVDDREAKVPDGLSYIAQNGGEVELAGAPGATSQLVYGGGIIALAAPGATIDARLADIGTGDVLELPGTITGVTFGAASLTITTDTGTFDFTNVTYAQGNIASYSVSHDNSTGLEAINFTGPDVFTANQAATSGAFSGDYLWSNAANWSDGVPAAGSAVQMAAVGVDDIAGLRLASLSLSGPNNDIDGQLFVEDGLIVNTLALTSSARIDIDGTGQANTLVIGGSASTTLSNGAAPTVDADGAGAVVDDREAKVPDGLSYIAQSGGEVELAGAPSATSQLVFGGGTIALAAPGATIDAKLSDIGTGDVLELPGTITGVTFGATSLIVTTDAGNFDFTNVTYAQGNIASYSVSRDNATGLEAISFTGPDIFTANQAAASGPFSGDYLWSNAANWSDGVPVAGGAVTMAAVGVDDIGGLSLGQLSLSGPNNDADGQLFVEDGLTINTLSLTSSARIDVDGTGQANTLIIGGSASTTLSNGAAPTLDADGAGAVVDDREAKVPDGLSYIAQNGGEVELAGAPSATSQLVFGGGTIALAAPGATIDARLADIGTGDVLELPGHMVKSATFGTGSLTITTDAGTFDFTNVSYDGTIDDYTTMPDDATGLEAIRFSGPDVFAENQAETTGPFSGEYLWSNAANWNGGLPTEGGAVEMAAVGVDDIAGLSLASLSVAPPSATTNGQLFVDADLTVNTLTVAASSEIDVVGSLQPTTLTVTGTLTNDGLITSDPSTLVFNSAVTGSGTIDIGAGSDVIFYGSVAATETVDFLSNTGTLTLADPAQFDAKVIGSGTEIIICYLRGTRVLTPAGEVPIETLTLGDRLVTRFGGVQAIKWIGRQSFSARFLLKNQAQWPVCIKSGALGDAKPVRDLYVSPGHSMLVDGTLILARNLVNGVTITQSQPTEDIHYYQVEFEAQDCIMAEGTWSESYADDEGLRNQFHNVGEFWELFPDYKSPSEPQLCAPRPESGPALEAALRPIIAQAAAGLTPGPLRGWIDTVEPERITGWAQDLNHPDLPVLLDIWMRGELLGTVLACDFRGDLEAARVGRGYCSFSFAMQTSISTASLQHLTICRSADGAALQMTTELRALLPDQRSSSQLERYVRRNEPGFAPGPLRGWIDTVDPDRITGWAQDLDHSDVPVLLDIWLLGQLLGSILAFDFREDLEAAGIGRGYCSFSFAMQISIPTASMQHLTVCRSADGAALQMTHELRAKAA